jgi:hypothetical protein
MNGVFMDFSGKSFVRNMAGLARSCFATTPRTSSTAHSATLSSAELSTFQRDNEMRNIVLMDAKARDKATRYFLAGRYER